MSEEFDIDAGVADIASDMGWESTDESTDEQQFEDNGVTDELQQEQKTEAAEEIAPPTRQAPASWAKEHREVWGQLPQQAQDYIELREKQMLDGIEQYKQGHAFSNEMQRAIEPFNDMLQQFGASPVQALQNSLEWNRALTSGGLEQRQQAFIKLGTDLGLIPQDGQPQVDQRTFELQQRLDRIERETQQRQQYEYQQNLSRVTNEVETFASDPANEHFDAVADDVIMLLQTGLDLKDAYDKAVWANPVTRAKEIAKATEAQNKQLEERKRAEAQAAKKAAGTNVKSARVNRQSEGVATGSWDDTMNEVMERIKSA